MDANIGTNIAPNVRYITRYVKERYVQKKIRRDLYERLVKWCGGDSVNVCLERALSVLESSAGATSAPNIGANIGTVSDTNIETNIGANVALSAPSPATSAPNIGVNIGTNATQATERRRSGHVWCRKRASIRSLDAFINWVRKTYGLVDWWESEGEVCFETLEAPEKSKGRGERKRRSEEGEVEAEALE